MLSGRDLRAVEHDQRRAPFALRVADLYAVKTTLFEKSHERRPLVVDFESRQHALTARQDVVHAARVDAVVLRGAKQLIARLSLVKSDVRHVEWIVGFHAGWIAILAQSVALHDVHALQVIAPNAVALIEPLIGASEALFEARRRGSHDHSPIADRACCARRLNGRYVVSGA